MSRALVTPNDQANSTIYTLCLCSFRQPVIPPVSAIGSPNFGRISSHIYFVTGAASVMRTTWRRLNASRFNALFNIAGTCEYCTYSHSEIANGVLERDVGLTQFLVVCLVVPMCNCMCVCDRQAILNKCHLQSFRGKKLITESGLIVPSVSGILYVFFYRLQVIFCRVQHKYTENCSGTYFVRN